MASAYPHFPMAEAVAQLRARPQDSGFQGLPFEALGAYWVDAHWVMPTRSTGEFEAYDTPSGFIVAKPTHGPDGRLAVREGTPFDVYDLGGRYVDSGTISGGSTG